MIFKKGMGWRACYDEKRNLYTAEIGGSPNHDLYEINKEIFDLLDDPATERPSSLICNGRHLYMAVDDRCGPPYTVILDEDYQELCPWAETMINLEARKTGEYGQYGGGHASPGWFYPDSVCG